MNKTITDQRSKQRGVFSRYFSFILVVAFCSMTALSASAGAVVRSPLENLTFAVQIAVHDPRNGDYLYGWPINTSPIHPERPVVVDIYGATGQLVRSVNSTVQYNPSTDFYTGVVDVGNNWPPGSYIVKLRLDYTLRGQVPGFVTISEGNSYTLQPTALRVGDINQDNKLSQEDYLLLVNCLSIWHPPVNCADQAKKRAADINDDGSVQELDYSLWLKILGNQPGD